MTDKKLITVEWNKNPGNLAFHVNIGDFAIDKNEIAKVGTFLKKYDPVLGKLVSKIDAFAKTAEGMKIKTVDDLNSATDFLKPMKDFKKDIENVRRQVVNPLNGLVKDINAIFKPRLELLDKIENDIKSLMRDWRIKEQRRIDAENARIEAENRKKSEKLQAKIEKAEESGKDIDLIPIPVFKEAKKIETSVKSENASAIFKKVKKYRIIDIEKIPRQYWLLDEKKIAKAVKVGVEIPGIEIYEDVETAIR